MFAHRLLLVPVLFFCLCGQTGATVGHGIAVKPARQVPEHILFDQEARPTVFPPRGRGWSLVFFGYTNCPDVCPMTLHKTGELMKVLGAESGRVTPVFVSIDSTRDNPEALRTFLGRVEVRALGLSGDPELLQTIANDFGVLVRRFQGKTALAYTLEHSSFLYLLDTHGRLRYLFPGSTSIEGMTEDLRRLWRDEAAVQQ